MATIKVESFPGNNSLVWKSMISSVNGNAFHLPEVFFNDGRAEYFLIRNRGEIIGAIVGMVKNEKKFKLFRGIKTIRFPTLPAMSEGNNKFIEEAIVELFKRARPDGYRKFSVEARWGQDFEDSELLSPHIKQTQLEFVIDLRRDMDQIEQSMHKKHRKNIKKALSNGIDIEIGQNLKSLYKMRKLQIESSHNAAEKGNIYKVPGKRHFKLLYMNVYEKGLGKILFAKRGGTYIAALAYITFNNKTATVRSGANQEGYRSSAMYLLQYELIRICKSYGHEELNIGGVPIDAMDQNHPNHGLYNFKKYFGGKQIKCHRLAMEL
jgi:hypothetical protein